MSPAPPEIRSKDPFGRERIIGVSPATKEVLVKDSTGQRYWKPATTEQVAEASQKIPQSRKETMPEIIYQPPEGISPGKPEVGSLASELKANEPAKVYNYRGEVVEIPQDKLSLIAGQQGEQQFKSLVNYRILPKGSQYVPAVEGWKYFTPRQVISKERYEEQVKSSVVIGDKAMARTDWNKLPVEYQQLAKSQGFGALERKLNADRAEAERIRNNLSPYKTDEGYNLPLALARGAVDEQELAKAGFKQSDIARASKTKQSAAGTGVAVSGDKQWMNTATGEIYSNQQRDALIKQSPEMRDRLVLTPASGKRLMIEATSFIFPPAKSALPEYTIKDVTPLEWGLGAANVALLVVPVAMPAKIAGTALGKTAMAGTQVVAGGIYTAHTVKNWGQMSPVERAVSVVIDTVLIGGVASGLKPVLSKGASAIASKAQGTISSMLPKGVPRPAAVAPIKQLTEGGVIGPWANLSDAQLVSAVAKGQKPLAWIEGVDAGAVSGLKAARQAGLNVKYFRIKIPFGKGYIKNYLVYENTATGRLALNRFLKAEQIDRSSISGLIDYHTEIGKALGYSAKDIRHFFNEWAGTDAGIREALRDITYALKTEDKLLLKQASARLQLSAGYLPKQLANPLLNKAKLMQADPYEWFSLAKKPPANPDLVDKGLRANKQFIDIAKRRLSKVKDPSRKQAIEKALREAQRQVKVATRVKVKTPLREVVWPKQAGKNLPAVAKSKALVRVGRRKKYIPKKELATKKLSELAGEYRVKQRDIIIAVSRLPLSERIALVIANPYISPKVIERITPLTRPQIEVMERFRASEDLQDQPKVAPVPQVKPEVSTRPSTKARDMPQTQPVTKPEATPMPKADKLNIVTEEFKMALKRTPKQEREKRKRILEAKGAIAFKMGQIRGKDRWDTVLYPYQGQDDYVIVFGKQPTGATVVRGRDSAYKTAQLLYGTNLSRKLTIDMGIQDIILEPIGGKKGVKISFEADPQLETKGDISIGKSGRVFPLRGGS